MKSITVSEAVYLVKFSVNSNQYTVFETLFGNLFGNFVKFVLY